MMKNRQGLQLCAVWLLVCLLASSCGTVLNSGPEAEARKLFEDWAQQAGIPYKDVSLATVNNDGAFATVQLTVSLRQSAAEDWLRKQTDIDCRHVGSEWQCNSGFSFSLTAEEQATQEKIVANTATAVMISFNSTATELARQVAATQSALEGTQRAFEQSANATRTAIALGATATALAPRPSAVATVEGISQIVEVAAGKPTIASSFYRGGGNYSFQSSGVVDRQIRELPCTTGTDGGNTYWLLADHQTGWVQIDLQERYTIVKLRWLNTHNGNCGDRATTKYRIVLSQTGDFSGEEILVDNGNMSYTTSPQYQELPLSTPVIAQYVRFYVDDYYNWGGGLNELEVYAEITTP